MAGGAQRALGWRVGLLRHTASHLDDERQVGQQFYRAVLAPLEGWPVGRLPLDVEPAGRANGPTRPGRAGAAGVAGPGPVRKEVGGDLVDWRVALVPPGGVGAVVRASVHDGQLLGGAVRLASREEKGGLVGHLACDGCGCHRRGTGREKEEGGGGPSSAAPRGDPRTADAGSVGGECPPHLGELVRKRAVHRSRAVGLAEAQPEEERVVVGEGQQRPLLELQRGRPNSSLMSPQRR